MAVRDSREDLCRGHDSAGCGHRFALSGPKRTDRPGGRALVGLPGEPGSGCAGKPRVQRRGPGALRGQPRCARRAAQTARVGAAGDPLEALWWVDDPDLTEIMAAVQRGEAIAVDADRERWRWQAMIVQPDPLDAGTVNGAVARIRVTRNLPSVDRLRYVRWAEGRCAQLLHVGPTRRSGRRSSTCSRESPRWTTGHAAGNTRST